MLYWLAIEREGTSIGTLRSDLVGTLSKTDLLPALMSLRRRSFIERDEHTAVFHLQPVLLEFITDRIIKQAGCFQGCNGLRDLFFKQLAVPAS